MYGTTGMTENNIGIFGGTFDPVHRAHVAIAEEFIRKFSLDMLYVIPNHVAPMKNPSGVSGKDRTEMLKIAFSGNDKIIISDIELLREGMSYTRDTVAELRDLHPDSRLFLLTGDDWIDSFDKWKDYRFILDNATLVVAKRSGKDISVSLDRLELLSGKRPETLNNEKDGISSTEFRNGLNEDLLPDGVYEYIKKRGLYGT